MIKNLKLIRVNKKISLGQMAKKIGVSRQSIWNYENGIRTPNLEHLIPLADAYGISVKDLVDSLLGDEKNEQGIN